MLNYNYNFAPVSGAVAQLGERLTGSQEVVGSIPSGSTIYCLSTLLLSVISLHINSEISNKFA